MWNDYRTPIDKYLDKWYVVQLRQQQITEQFKREAMAGIQEIPTTPHPKGLE